MPLGSNMEKTNDNKKMYTYWKKPPFSLVSLTKSAPRMRSPCQTKEETIPNQSLKTELSLIAAAPRRLI